MEFTVKDWCKWQRLKCYHLTNKHGIRCWCSYGRCLAWSYPIPTSLQGLRLEQILVCITPHPPKKLGYGTVVSLDTIVYPKYPASGANELVAFHRDVWAAQA